MTPVSISILTEDSGQDAYEVVHSLFRSMLKLIDAQLPLYDRSRISIQPSTDPERQAMRGNIWQAHKSREARILIQRYIERQVRRHDAIGFVIIHVDGDRPYHQSKAGTESHNQQRLENDIISKVRISLQDQPSLLERIMIIVPFYSIESWLYQNTREALRLLDLHYRSHDGDRRQFQHWQNNRHELDEVSRPKELVSIHARFNRELACQNFPAQQVYDVEKSFHKSVERLRACRALIAALESTRSQWEQTLPEPI
uniref:Uncharacterized protein n=1 Tax=uncultured bacterium A1Q1_fos_1807 TaxID=1256552 RepID=L7W060_9BACT|nr:hypothetical protein [uncultured bacterium A1Q1_fos_1807]